MNQIKKQDITTCSHTDQRSLIHCYKGVYSAQELPVYGAGMLARGAVGGTQPKALAEIDRNQWGLHS